MGRNMTLVRVGVVAACFGLALQFDLHRSMSVAAEPEMPGFSTGGLRSPEGTSGSEGTGSPDAFAQSHASIQALTTVGKDTVYAGSFGMGIFRSDDRGGGWAPSSEGLTDPFVLCLATGRDGAVYAGTFRGGVFRTRDQGKSWQSINSGLKRHEIKALLISGDVIYAGTGDGVYQLSGANDRWVVVTEGLNEVLVHSLARSADGTLFAGTSGKGVMRYKDSASGWSRMRHGLKDHEGMVENFIRVLAIDKEQGIYAGTFDGGVFRSADGGQTWRQISRALPNDSIRGIVSNDRGLFVATGRGIYKTVDKGHQWIPLNKGLSNLAIQVLVESHNGAFYAGTTSGVFRSDDDGGTWVSVNEGLQGGMVSPFRFPMN